jgi:hypothetical protein
VIIVGCADITVVADGHVFPELLEIRDNFINVGLRFFSGFFRAFLDFHAVFVRACAEHHVKALPTLIAGNSITGNCSIAVSDVRIP